MTKFHPILFSTPMVQAIREGRKTMTRRTAKGVKYTVNQCPYGKVGDVLWVRETSTQESITDEAPFKTIYKADVGENYPMGSNKWKPSIFMPKSACRIFLEITDIKIERLQDISEEDAKAEGVETKKGSWGTVHFIDYTSNVRGSGFDWAKQSFKTLWQKINGSESWEENPFVWVIKFKQIDKPENFN